MRLLNVKTLQFEEFVGDATPEYVILSHTWDPKELTYQAFMSYVGNDIDFANSLLRTIDDPLDFMDLLWTARKLTQEPDGLRKVIKCCQLAGETNYRWLWIDTCCINKESSAELSEAINSMFAWYRDATVCWAYLSDVELPPEDESDSEPGSPTATKDPTADTDPTAATPPASPPPPAVASAPEHGDAPLKDSRWFRRGWTLQELIAPSTVRFYDRLWRYIGTKTGLSEEISKVTGIDVDLLTSAKSSELLSSYSVADRMSWAAERESTRQEDIAYSLLGIFQVHMSLLYGEGQNAFLRLQKKIMKSTSDETIFAWDDSHFEESGELLGLLAPHPRAFSRNTGIKPLAVDHDPISITNRGAGVLIFDSQRPLLSTTGVVMPLNCIRRSRIIGISIARYRDAWYRAKGPLRPVGKPADYPVLPFDYKQRQTLYVSFNATSIPVDGDVARHRHPAPCVTIRLNKHIIPGFMLNMSADYETVKNWKRSAPLKSDGVDVFDIDSDSVSDEGSLSDDGDAENVTNAIQKRESGRVSPLEIKAHDVKMNIDDALDAILKRPDPPRPDIPAGSPGLQSTPSGLYPHATPSGFTPYANMARILKAASTMYSTLHEESERRTVKAATTAAEAEAVAAAATDEASMDSNPEGLPVEATDTGKEVVIRPAAFFDAPVNSGDRAYSDKEVVERFTTFASFYDPRYESSSDPRRSGFGRLADFFTRRRR